MNSDSQCPSWINSTAFLSFSEDQNSWKVQTVDQTWGLKVRPDRMVEKRAASPGDNLLIPFDHISLHQPRLKAKKCKMMIRGYNTSEKEKYYILTKYIAKTLELKHKSYINQWVNVSVHAVYIAVWMLRNSGTQMRRNQDNHNQCNHICVVFDITHFAVNTWTHTLISSLLESHNKTLNRVYKGPNSREEYSIQINLLWKTLNLPLPVLLVPKSLGKTVPPATYTFFMVPGRTYTVWCC